MAITPAADLQVLFVDNFSAPLDSKVWDYPHFSAINNPSFYGRTQIRQSLPDVSGGSVHLALDTFNPTGLSLYGSEIITRQTFSPNGGGIAFEASARLVTATSGIVGSVFGYNFDFSTHLHDEIDFELLGNDAAAGRSRVQTNVYANEPLGAGHGQFVPVTDLTSFHVYRMEWYSTAVRWFIDGQLVREDTAHVPQGAMALHANIWAPDKDWADAYSELLQPVSSAASNTTYYVDVDYVRVSRLPLSLNNVSGTSGNDFIHGLSDGRTPLPGFNEITSATEDADKIDGNEGNDQLFGNGGDDFLSGGLGADTLDGGNGTDVADYFNATTGIQRALPTRRSTPVRQRGISTTRSRVCAAPPSTTC
jgi:hypothetical protein